MGTLENAGHVAHELKSNACRINNNPNSIDGHSMATQSNPLRRTAPILNFYMDKNTPERKDYVMSTARGLRAVALFEAAKGVLVLLAGLGLLEFLNRDTQKVAEELVRHFHLNPANQQPRIFLLLSEQATPAHLWALAAGAAAYAALRFVEAYGLWRQRRWAEWFAVISGGIYVPWELMELIREVTWPRAVFLTLNLVVVGYLIWQLKSRETGGS